MLLKGLDVLYQGFAFRVWIEDAVPQAIELHLFLHALSTRAEASQSIRLVTRLTCKWVEGHRLKSQLSVEAVELLVASLYLDCFPLDPPRGALAGLLRFFHRLVAFDWASNVLYIGDEAKREAANEAFVALRLVDAFLLCFEKENNSSRIDLRFCSESGRAPPMAIVTADDEVCGRTQFFFPCKTRVF